MLIWGLLILVTGWCFTLNSEGRTGRALWVWRGNRTCGNMVVVYVLIPTLGNLGQPSIRWVIITQWSHLIDTFLLVFPYTTGFSQWLGIIGIFFLTIGKTLRKNNLGGTWIFLSIFGKSMTVTGCLGCYFLLFYYQNYNRLFMC